MAEDADPSPWNRFFTIVSIFVLFGPFFWAIGGGIPIALLSCLWSGQWPSSPDLPAFLAIMLVGAFVLGFALGLGTGAIFAAMAVCFGRASYWDAGLAALVTQAALSAWMFAVSPLAGGRWADWAIFVPWLVAALICRRFSRQWASPAAARGAPVESDATS